MDRVDFEVNGQGHTRANVVKIILLWPVCCQTPLNDLWIELGISWMAVELLGKLRLKGQGHDVVKVTETNSS